MVRTSHILILLTINFFSFQLEAQPKIIFDTDFGGDADDLGALVMLHHYLEKDQCDLLGIMVWSTEKYAVPAIDAVNRYYGHPDIPIGVRKDSVHTTDWHYNQAICNKLPYTRDYSSAPNAIKLYRKILSESPKRSITIVTVGPLKNIQDLIESPPDDYSSLTGKELIVQKIKEFVIMGGKFPEGKGEWNFDGGMEGVTDFVLSNLHVPIVFLGYEIGVEIKTGDRINTLPKETPLYLGYYHFSKNAPWMMDYFDGDITDNSSYDQTAVLYAIEGGIGQYWNRISNGHVQVMPNGDNQWIKGKKKNQSYLELITDPDELAKKIEEIMLAPPEN